MTDKWNGAKFFYIKADDGKRVLTIAFKRLVDDIVTFGYAENKLLDDADLKLDGRLRKLIGNLEFERLQKQFIKKFRGDVHNKKIARQVAFSRLRQGQVKKKEGQGNLEAVLTAFLSFMDGYSNCQEKRSKRQCRDCERLTRWKGPVLRILAYKPNKENRL